MKEILEKIIKLHTKEIDIYKSTNNGSYLIILDKNQSPSDFFKFLFLNAIPENDYIEKYFKEFGDENIDISSKDSNNNKSKRISDFNSFEKNLNLIIFIQVDNDLNINKELKKSAYLMEENPYFFRKKIIFYTKEQISSFNNYSLNLDDLGNILNDINDPSKRFLLNLIIGLSFVKAKFNNINKAFAEKKIFEESFQNIKTNGPFKIGDDYSEFNRHIKDIYEKIDNNDLIDTKNISKFEEELLSLFTNSEEIRKSILSTNTNVSHENN